MRKETEHRLRNLHNAVELYLAGSRLKKRFSVGLNPTTLRWTISFEKLAPKEFTEISNVSSRFGLNQMDKTRHKTILVIDLTSTQTRDFARAVAARFLD